MSYYLRTNIKQKMISDEFAKQLLMSQKFLAKYSRIFTYKYIIDKNLDDLISYLKSFQDNYNGKEMDFAECNRLIYNTLNTFYAYQQFFNKEFGKEIKSVKQYFYGQYFEYSIICALRDYMEHSDLGVSNIIVTHGKYGSKAKAYIDIKKIADDIRNSNKFGGFKQNVEQMIKLNKETQVEVLSLFENFKSIFYKIQVSVWEMLSRQILENFKCIGNIFNIIEGKKREIILYNDNRYIYPISIIYHNFYIIFSSRFIISENVMENEDEKIKEFYKALSFEYYGEIDKYYPKELD